MTLLQKTFGEGEYRQATNQRFGEGEYRQAAKQREATPDVPTCGDSQDMAVNTGVKPSVP